MTISMLVVNYCINVILCNNAIMQKTLQISISHSLRVHSFCISNSYCKDKHVDIVYINTA